MPSKRIRDLILLAAKEYKRGSNPFEAWWLSEHAVTLEECMTLSENIAYILHWYTNQPESVRRKMTIEMVRLAVLIGGLED